MARRGEIYYVDWSAGRGAEQAGIRPALIVQNDTGNQFSPTTIVAAISAQRCQPYPFQVLVMGQESGLTQTSVIKCEQIHSIDQGRLGRLVGTLPAVKMDAADLALHRSLGLEH